MQIENRKWFKTAGLTFNGNIMNNIISNFFLIKMGWSQLMSNSWIIEVFWVAMVHKSKNYDKWCQKNKCSYPISHQPLLISTTLKMAFSLLWHSKFGKKISIFFHQLKTEGNRVIMIFWTIRGICFKSSFSSSFLSHCILYYNS